MAAATSTAIEPYSPPTGVPLSHSIAHATDWINKLSKKYRKDTSALSETADAHRLEADAHRAKTDKIKTEVAIPAAVMGLSFGVGAAAGLIDGRYGGESGYWEKAGFTVANTLALTGHASAFTLALLGDPPAWVPRMLHAVGDAGLAQIGYRHAHAKMTALRAGASVPTSAAAPVNGAKGGTVYTVPAAPPAHK